MKRRQQTLPEALRAASTRSNSEEFGESRGPLEHDQRCGLLIRLTPALRQKLKLRATASGQTMQHLVLEAIIELLEPDHAPARKGGKLEGTFEQADKIGRQDRQKTGRQ